MLFFKIFAILVGLGISLLAAGLVLYDACLAVNFQRHAARHTAERLPSPAPDFCRPAVFLYQRGLAGDAAQPGKVRVLRIRRRVRAWRRGHDELGSAG